jgi:beta-N-acetylhexosaminidase
VADVATRPDNPSLGIRSFGEDPTDVARLVQAMTLGFSEAGIACTAKHFPGKGEAVVDPHYELPLLALDRDRLERVELPPFRAAFAAGVGLLMMGHYVVPALTGSDVIPISASERGIDGFVRAEMGFDGVVITDALDMGALDQGPAQVVDIITMMRGGTDLLLCMPDPALQERVRVAVERGVSRGLIDEATLTVSRRRIETLRKAIPEAGRRPGLVGTGRHLELAAQLAARSITVARNDAGLIPLSLSPGARVLSLEPVPTNVTPADTTALYPPLLAKALRAHHGSVTEVVYPYHPERSDIDAAMRQADVHDLVVVGTVTATNGQADLVRGLIAGDRPVVTVALRTPYDLAAYPGASTHLCTYGSHLPSLTALAGCLFNGIADPGSLPVSIPGLYPIGHGLTV